MTNCKPNWTLITQVVLGLDPESEPYDQKDWNYVSVVGMLLYVSNNTRPDMTLTVSQVAHFTAAPKVSNAKAIKLIVRYLVCDPDKDLIIKPDGTYDLKCWVDTDFAGLYGRESDTNPKFVKSQYRYIVTFGGVPLIWKSQLILEICLSTIHPECIGLTNALRALIPIQNLIIDTLTQLDMPFTNKPKILCCVFEDNQGAYILATNQQLLVRTKDFCVKYHFF